METSTWTQWRLSSLEWTDGSWWVQCLIAVPEPEWLSVHLTSARSETSARGPATWSTACDLRSTSQVTDFLVTTRSDHCTKHTTQQSTLTVTERLHPATSHYCWHCLNISLQCVANSEADVQSLQWLRNIGGILLTWSAYLTNLMSSPSCLTKWHIQTLDFCWCYFAISDVVFCTVFSFVYWL